MKRRGSKTCDSVINCLVDRIVEEERYAVLLSGDVDTDVASIFEESASDQDVIDLLEDLSIDTRAQKSGLREALRIINEATRGYDGTPAECVAQLRAGS